LEAVLRGGLPERNTAGDGWGIGLINGLGYLSLRV